MSSASWRRIVAITTVVLLVAACGNSSKKTDTSPTTSGGSGGPTTTAAGTADDRDTFVSISGVPGVTDKEIAFAAVGTRTNNPLGTCVLDCYLQGIKAYFAYRNDEGGIYGRDLVLSQEIDDELGNNQVKALEVISGKKAFGAFEATLLASGWGDLDGAGIPTYAWGINADEAANRSHIFPSAAIRCADCTTRSVPYAVKTAGAKHVATLGYGISANSKVCANTTAAAVKKYSADIGADAAYVNDSLDYGLPNGIGPVVTAMKKAKVDFISTCIDLKGMKTLAQELERQGMQDVTLYHPNSYDQAFVADAGAIFEGDFVTVQFLPFESDTGNEALAAFQKWMKAQGDTPTELAMVGWINASLAFDGLLAAGPSFDQAKVTAATNAMTAYDAGGLINPIDWTAAHEPYTQATRAGKETQECSVLVRIEKAKFTTVGPADKPWLCWDGASLDWSDPVPTAFG